MATATTDALNSLLRGEISATETYTQALEKFAGQPEEAELRRMRDGHREAANTLRQHVRDEGGQPSTGSGWWGAWAKCVEGAAQVFSKATALKARKRGEGRGVKDYNEALKGDALAADCKALVSGQLLPRCQAHVPALDRLISSQ